jgi:hypothetical protein
MTTLGRSAYLPRLRLTPRIALRTFSLGSALPASEGRAPSRPSFNPTSFLEPYRRAITADYTDSTEIAEECPASAFSRKQNAAARSMPGEQPL